jgi:hypothetical protein
MFNLTNFFRDAPHHLVDEDDGISKVTRGETIGEVSIATTVFAAINMNWNAEYASMCAQTIQIFCCISSKLGTTIQTYCMLIQIL